jgi:hypothetical protein
VEIAGVFGKQQRSLSHKDVSWILETSLSLGPHRHTSWDRAQSQREGYGKTDLGVGTPDKKGDSPCPCQEALITNQKTKSQIISQITKEQEKQEEGKRGQRRT